MSCAAETLTIATPFAERSDAGSQASNVVLVKESNQDLVQKNTVVFLVIFLITFLVTFLIIFLVTFLIIFLVIFLIIFLIILLVVLLFLFLLPPLVLRNTDVCDLATGKLFDVLKDILDGCDVSVLVDDVVGFVPSKQKPDRLALFVVHHGSRVSIIG